jgi:hypothetical protein
MTRDRRVLRLQIWLQLMLGALLAGFFLGFLAGAALAQDPPWRAGPEVEIEHLDGNPFARIVFHNIEGTATRPYTFDTAHGAVTVSVVMTPNSGGLGGAPLCCPDEFRAIAWPEGVVALPPQQTVPENADAEILLYRWEGM